MLKPSPVVRAAELRGEILLPLTLYFDPMTGGHTTNPEHERAMESAVEHANDQLDLRTPPAWWPCIPSPRMFGINREQW